MKRYSAEYLLHPCKSSEEPKELITKQIKQLKRQGADLIGLIYSKGKDYYPNCSPPKKLILHCGCPQQGTYKVEGGKKLKQIFTIAN